MWTLTHTPHTHLCSHKHYTHTYVNTQCTHLYTQTPQSHTCTLTQKSSWAHLLFSKVPICEEAPQNPLKNTLSHGDTRWERNGRKEGSRKTKGRGEERKGGRGGGRKGEVVRGRTRDEDGWQRKEGGEEGDEGREGRREGRGLGRREGGRREGMEEGRDKDTCTCRHTYTHKQGTICCSNMIHLGLSLIPRLRSGYEATWGLVILLRSHLNHLG